MRSRHRRYLIFRSRAVGPPGPRYSARVSHNFVNDFNLSPSKALPLTRGLNGGRLLAPGRWLAFFDCITSVLAARASLTIAQRLVPGSVAPGEAIDAQTRSWAVVMAARTSLCD